MTQAAVAALGAYGAFVRAAFLKMLAYRLRYVTGIFSYLIYVATYYYLWRAVYSHSGGATVAGLSLEEMVTYVAAGWIARSFYFNNVDRDLADQVAAGEIASLLARPVSLQGVMVASSLGEALFRLAFFSLPITAALLVLFPVGLPPTWQAALAFPLSCALALLVFAHVNFLVGLSALRLKSIQGVMRAKHYLIEILSGLLAPLEFFPAWLAALCRLLPFQAIAFLPASIYLGRFHGRALLEALAIQAGWALALALLSALAWRRAARSLTVHGG